jgi:hypothetical protein
MLKNFILFKLFFMSDKLFKNNLRNNNEYKNKIYDNKKAYSRKTTSTISSKSNYDNSSLNNGLKNQILQVLNLRLFIQNIKISAEQLNFVIEENLKLIDFKKIKASTINVFVDDLVEIIKKDYVKKEDSFHEGEEDIRESEESNRKSNILNFHKKLYTEDTISKMSNSINKKKEKLIIQPPMKFNLENNKMYNCNQNDYMKNNSYRENNNIVDHIKEMEERIIREVSSQNKKRQTIQENDL